jgi:hypothetical protein
MLIYFVWVLRLYVRIVLRYFLMNTQWKAPWLRLSISILCGATLPWVILGRSEKPCLTNCDMMAKNHGDSGEFKVLTINIYIHIYILYNIYIYIQFPSSIPGFIYLIWESPGLTWRMGHMARAGWSPRSNALNSRSTCCFNHGMMIPNDI